MAAALCRAVRWCRQPLRPLPQLSHSFHSEPNSPARRKQEKQVRKKYFEKNSADFAKKDLVRPDYQLVYQLSKSLSEATSINKFVGPGALAVSAGLLPAWIFHSLNTGEQHFRSLGMGFDNFGWSFGAMVFLVLNCLACMRLTIAIPERIYYSEQRERFLFIMNNPVLPVKTYQLEGSPGELVNIETSTDYMNLNKMRHLLISEHKNEKFLLLRTFFRLFIAGGSKLYIFPDCFRDEFYYAKLLGEHSDNSAYDD